MLEQNESILFFELMCVVMGMHSIVLVPSWKQAMASVYYLKGGK